MEEKKSGFAVTGLVLGIIGIVFSFIPIINGMVFVVGSLAIIFAAIGLAKKSSKGQAIAGLVLGILAIVITYCSNFMLANTLNEVSKSLSDWADETEKSLTVDSQSPDKMTLDKFNQIKTGMTYQQVVDLVGSEGTLSTESSYGNQSMKIYYWYASNGISNATVTFSNGKVSAKSQIGL